MAELKIPGRGVVLASIVVIGLILGFAPFTPTAVGAADSQTGDRGQVFIVVLPQGITPDDLESLDRAAIGLMNGGLGEVSAQQTWLDISQGARAFDMTYDTPLDRVYPGGESAQGWEKVVRRAETSDSTIVPGLMASVLAENGHDAVAAESAGSAALVAAKRNGSIARAPLACGGPESMIRPESPGAKAAIAGCPDPVTVLSMPLSAAFEAARDRGITDLQIFIERPPADAGDQLTVAIAGQGYGGMVQSPSTRTDGYVLSTDIAPTVLEHFGDGIPRAMTGLPIESGGELDLDRLAELEGRYEQVGKRRGAALAIPLLLWIGLVALISAGSRGIYARPAVRLLCLSTILLPGVLLLTAALSPTLGIERMIATLLPVLVAAVLMRLAPGWLALAAACGLTVIPYGIDMLAGSVLTPLSVIGPNPGLGARFYGIGNELESTLMILTSIGTGAALTYFRVADRPAAITFLVVGLVSTVVFAAGRFGADVGAAIVFPVAAVVAASIAAGRPRLAWVGLAVAAVTLGLLALVDILSGSETHFVRSVFGGDGSFTEVIGHRLDATLQSFTRLSRIPVTLAALVVIALGVWKRDRIQRWLEDVPLVRAGFLAAASGSLVGSLTNDSGVLFIQVGTLYLALVLGFAWTAARSRQPSG